MIDKSFQALIFSLILHLLLALAFLRAPAPEKSPSLTDVEILYDSPRSQRVVIDDLKPEEETPVEKLKKQAENLSRLNRRVKQEQVARPAPLPDLKDLTRPGPQQAPQQAGKTNSEIPSDSRPLHLPGLEPTQPETSGQGEFSRSVVIGGSTQGEWIPGVKEGAFTALNTDQFTYYSFFARVKEAIRFRWVQRVRNFSQQASPEEITALARIPSPTQLEVTLSKQGDVLKIATLKTSGSNELDKAAEQAFWAASPLNNPPVEMADEDGLIRLYYSFQVIWQPRYTVESRQ